MSKKLKRSAVALVLAATMVFSSQGVLTAFAVGENETSTAVDVSALGPILDKEETVVVEGPGNTDETETPEVTESCDKTEGCTLSKGHNGECVTEPVTPPEEENGEGEKQPCTKTEGCTLENGHEGECVTEPVTPPEEENGEDETQPCQKTEGCILPNGHEDECVVEENTEDTEDTQEPSEEDVAAAKNVSDLIGALPEASTLDPETTDLEALTAQVKAAREAYDKLTDAQKALVEQAVLDKLVALEGALEALQNTNVADVNAVAKIGDTTYDTLDKAITAAADGNTIEVLANCETEGMNLSKNLTIKGKGADGVNPEIKFTKYGIALWGKALTFQDCKVTMNGIGSTPYTAEWNWQTICASKDASLTLDNVEMTMDASGTTNSPHAIYFCNNNVLNIIKGSNLTIKNYANDALEWDGGNGGYNVNITDSTFISDHNRSGFTGTFYATITNSDVDVINSTGNGSNGSHFIIENSNVNFSNNGSHGLSAGELSIDNSIVTCEKNGGMGISVNDNFEVKNNSKVTVTENALKNTSNFAYAAVRLYNNHTFTVDKTSKLYINNNHNTGLYVRQGNLTVEDGAVLEIIGNNVENNLLNGYGGGIYVGYGDNYDPTVVLPADAKIYNNHARVGGDDIYVSEGVNGPSLTFGKVGEGWTLDGDPDCTDAITGWFDDSEGNRWEAHDAPLHVSEFTNFNDAGIATISGLTALKAAHPYLTPEIEPGDPDVPSSDWPISKSKTAENLDENFESKVTLSLPADSYKPSVDVVMVMDVSSSMKGEDITEAKAAATAMCDELASKTNANVNIGIVTFDKEARNLTNGLVSIEEAKNAINNIKASEDTNMMAGLIAGKAMLDAGTATDKYLVIMSDGIPIYWVENGETISKTLIRYKQDKVTEIDRLPAGSEPEGSAPEDFDSMLSIKQLLNITDWDTDSNEWKQVSDTGENINPDCKYTNIQKATYKTAQYMIDNIFGQYKIKMVAFGTDKYENNVVYKYGENLCDWIGDQDGVSYYKVSKPNYGGEAGDLVEAFTDIANEMIYLVDAGSQVVDEIGFGTYEDGTEYDFDFVNEISKLELTVGGKALDKVQIDDYTYGFGPDSTLPKDYQFIVTYYPNGLTRSVAGELFVWDIYVPITIDDKVQLTYSVKLNDPRTDDGEYGIYDPDGSANRNGLYTNNAAVLYPVDSNGNNGEPEAFDKPTVSYTVDNGNDNPGTDPTPDPDPDPDRPSRPNRDDDDDWEPLPDAPVKDKPTTEVDVPEETETPTTEQPDKYNPETGDTTTVFAAMALAAVSLGGVVLLGRKKK